MGEDWHTGGTAGRPNPTLLSIAGSNIRHLPFSAPLSSQVAPYTLCYTLDSTSGAKESSSSFQSQICFSKTQHLGLGSWGFMLRLREAFGHLGQQMTFLASRPRIRQRMPIRSRTNRCPRYIRLVRLPQKEASMSAERRDLVARHSAHTKR